MEKLTSSMACLLVCKVVHVNRKFYSKLIFSSAEVKFYQFFKRFSISEIVEILSVVNTNFIFCGLFYLKHENSDLFLRYSDIDKNIVSSKQSSYCYSNYKPNTIGIRTNRQNIELATHLANRPQLSISRKPFSIISPHEKNLSRWTCR